MAFEIRGVEEEALGTVKSAKYEMYEVAGGTDFTLSSVTYQFINMATDVTTLSGSGTVNNSDTDAAGNTIKTITIPLDLSETGVVAGYYALVWTVTLTGGITDCGRAIYHVRDYTEVF